MFSNLASEGKNFSIRTTGDFNTLIYLGDKKITLDEFDEMVKVVSEHRRLSDALKKEVQSKEAPIIAGNLSDIKFGSVKNTIQTIPRRHLNFAIVDISWDIKSHTDAMERLKTLRADFGDHIRLISAHECRRWLAELGDTVDTSSITFITNDESVILPGKLKSDPVLIATVFVENNSTLLNHG